MYLISKSELIALDNRLAELESILTTQGKTSAEQLNELTKLREELSRSKLELKEARSLLASAEKSSQRLKKEVRSLDKRFGLGVGYFKERVLALTYKPSRALSVQGLVGGGSVGGVISVWF